MTTRPPTQFSTFIQEYRNGALDDQLTAAFADVARGVKMLEKTGSVTLKFKLSEQGGAVVIEHAMAHVVPQPKTTGQVWFASEDGVLTRHHPDQPSLPFDNTATTTDQKDTSK
jgi:hypothetical protein